MRNAAEDTKASRQNGSLGPQHIVVRNRKDIMSQVGRRVVFATSRRVDGKRKQLSDTADNFFAVTDDVVPAHATKHVEESRTRIIDQQ